MKVSIINKPGYSLPKATSDILVFVISLICIFLFLYTGYSKLADHARFLKGISKVQIVGQFAGLISWAVPILEILIALLMIIPKSCRVGLFAFTALMILFTIYIGSALLWAKKLPCRCGGVIEKLTWTQHLVFNLGFVSLACLALWISNRKIY